MDSTNYLFIFMTALFAALIMVPALRRWALDTGAVDVPDARKVHTQVIPRVGGIGIFIAAVFSLLVFFDFDFRLRGILAGGFVVFVTGLIDDLHGLSPRWKFFGQVFGCVITITVADLKIHSLGNLFGTGAIQLNPLLAVLFTIFAVVGVVNAVNLIDGLDGLAGGVSVIALSAFLTLGYLDGNASAMALCAATLGGVLGFLKYNFYPARIFMGDTGSLVVGYLLGFLAVLLTQGQGSAIPAVVPVLILGLPLIDTIWVMTRRVVEGKSPFAPDRTHVHHKFLDLGLEHRFTVLVIYGISLFWALFAILFHQRPEYFLLGFYLLFSVAAYVGLRYLSRHRDRFRFFAKDSAGGIRETATYRRIADLCAMLVPPGVAALFLVFLLISLVWGEAAGGRLWQVCLLLFIGGAGLLYFTRDTANSYLLAILFLVGLVFVFCLENQTPLGAGRPIPLRIADFTLGTMALLVLGMTIFPKRGAHFLSTVDFLVFSFTVFAAIVLFQTPALMGYTSLIWRGLVLYLALKIMAGQNRIKSGYMVYPILGVLLILGVRSWLGPGT
ncbi:hypothetical protein DESUT3_24600 [Desulfuromonas versatilis]|uniref:Undecaprenyl/decaprenyl-phosphate alpha-N-acetylglucosaminyl 1-phosphate transferase n=1 Tax=Desulfuromonas versatilis TaxID=2802975 RepID=A0ABN6DZH8_9BACT|nr:MraY family glycosyltransferase [Desulfuromonas versatilis]BCR05391.1 hypothetical protein DESUT3_24600 [Desulfuromonas versatilis]